MSKTEPVLSTQKRAVCLLASVLVIGLCSCAGKTPPSPVSDNLQTLEKWRAQSESHAKTLKSKYTTTSDQYKESERRYIGAETKANAMIDRMLIDFLNNVDISSSTIYGDALDAAVIKFSAFMAYPEAWTESREEKIDRQTLKDATVRLWKEYAKGDSALREKIRAKLRQLKWKPFNEL
jgi:hypothetical protein